MALDNSIPVANNYRKYFYFVFKLGKPVLLGGKGMAEQYACISRYLWHKKNEIKHFYEKASLKYNYPKHDKWSLEHMDRKAEHRIVPMLLQ